MILEGRVAVVTGGGRGIGRAIALRFAVEGARVMVAARSAAEIEAVSAEIRAAGGTAAHVIADVASEADCRRIVAATREALGPIEILVNNAGVLGPVAAVTEVSAQEWDQVMLVNLRGPFLMCRLVLAEMYKRGRGNILNISSIAAKAPFQMNAPYAASKAGLLGLTRTLAAEAARRGVRVNALSPGPVPETKMSQALGRALVEHTKADPEKMFAAMLEGILQGRAQTAEEIAAAALFLVSDQSSVITGQALNADGGMAFC